jgi:hypothetical protein
LEVEKWHAEISGWLNRNVIIGVKGRRRRLNGAKIQKSVTISAELSRRADSLWCLTLSIV